MNPIEEILNSDNPKIEQVVKNLERHEVQILFTEVISENDQVHFEDYSFNVNEAEYFYPASTVKFPVAVLALEKLNNNAQINRNMPFQVEGDSLRTTISKEIQKIFAVSDNEAYNRLFMFLGSDYINNTLDEKDIVAKISHKLSTSDQAIYSLNFFKNDSIIFTIRNKKDTVSVGMQQKKLMKGKGYISGDSLIQEPMDFSKKNYLPLISLHNMMKRLIYPEKFTPNERFHISDSDRKFLLNNMKLLPREAGYESEEYYDSYVKFFLFGDDKADMPEHIEIYNKVGYAYGYLTDCAYIFNKNTEKSYFLTATIHVNENQIYNDGVYEYEDIGIPFLAELGRQLILTN